jgi:hypothetical protein
VELGRRGVEDVDVLDAPERGDGVSLVGGAEGEPAADRRGEQPAQPVDALLHLVAQLAQLELRAVGVLTALPGHHGDQQVGEVEGAHDAVQEVALATGLRLDPRVDGDGFLGEEHERLVVATTDDVDECQRQATRRREPSGRVGGCGGCCCRTGSRFVERRPGRRHPRRRSGKVAVEQQLEDPEVLDPLDQGRL